jgi:hypothetical protein
MSWEMVTLAHPLTEGQSLGLGSTVKHFYPMYLSYRYPPLAVASDIYSMVLCHGTPNTERNKDMLRVHVESSLDISLFMVQSIV